MAKQLWENLNVKGKRRALNYPFLCLSQAYWYFKDLAVLENSTRKVLDKWRYRIVNCFQFSGPALMLAGKSLKEQLLDAWLLVCYCHIPKSNGIHLVEFEKKKHFARCEQHKGKTFTSTIYST